MNIAPHESKDYLSLTPQAKQAKYDTLRSKKPYVVTSFPKPAAPTKKKSNGDRCMSARKAGSV